MRIVFWNCNMALPRKWDHLCALRPDVAVISECAAPEVLANRGMKAFAEGQAVWHGKNPNKGLGVFAFGAYHLTASAPFFPTLQFLLPVRVEGPEQANLLAVWAQNASGGVSRKHQLGPLRRGLRKYETFLRQPGAVVGGDMNNNVFWDRPGWRINWAAHVEIFGELGLESAYHRVTGEAQGAETVPTHYWRDRKKDGPTYHIDYAFVPIGAVISRFEVGRFEDWVGNGLSDHVPLVLDVELG